MFRLKQMDRGHLDIDDVGQPRVGGRSRAASIERVATMGKVYDFLSRWTKIDELLAPYSARIFEKVATGYGRTMMAIGAGVGIAMLIVSRSSSELGRTESRAPSTPCVPVPTTKRSPPSGPT